MVDSITWQSMLRGDLQVYIAKNLPVVITDIPKTFLPSTWTINNITQLYGDTTIRVLKSTEQFFRFDDKKEREIVQMPLREFIEKGVDHPGCDGFYYALGRSPIDQFGDLRSQMNLPEPLAKIVAGPLRKPERNLWISPKGTRTALHFDAVENLNIQIEGHKHFFLFPPRIKNMHCYPANSQAAYVSSVDPRGAISELDFPLDIGVDVSLKAGHMLYVPYGWWHQVDTVGNRNINANYWWFPRIKLLAYPRQSYRGAMVLLHRKGKHPHKRAEELAKK